MWLRAWLSQALAKLDEAGPPEGEASGPREQRRLPAHRASVKEKEILICARARALATPQQ